MNDRTINAWLWFKNRGRALVEARGNPSAYRRKVRVGKSFERAIQR